MHSPGLGDPVAPQWTGTAPALQGACASCGPCDLTAAHMSPPSLGTAFLARLGQLLNALEASASCAPLLLTLISNKYLISTALYSERVSILHYKSTLLLLLIVRFSTFLEHKPSDCPVERDLLQILNCYGESLHWALYSSRNKSEDTKMGISHRRLL